MNALDSLNKSLKSYVQNEHGFREDVIYTDSVTNTEYETSIAREYKDNKNKNRDIESDEISDSSIFMITLPIVPKRNDTITFVSDSKVYYVDYFETITSEMFRIFVDSDTQSVPSPSKTYEI